MATSDLLNERHITNARVYIEGDEIDFVSLSLEQSFSEHHSFRVVMDYDTLKQDFMKNPLEQMKLIGQFLDIDLMQGDDSGNAYEFRGVIRDVYHEGQEGKHGYLILEGLSPTILLERGKRLDIFCNMNLGQVFDQVTDNIINKKDRLPCVNKPHYTGQVNFLMQYKESDWEFLRRLSAISGETLLYTGMDLVFGEYKDWSPVEVTYDKEITSFQFGTRLLANNFTRYQYLAEQDDTITQDAPATIDNANEYVNTAADSSKELTEKRPVRTPSSLPIGDIGSLNELVAREKSVTASETVYVRGTAKTCAPRIGRQLTINMPANMGGASDLGTYRIVKVKHTIDQNHRYKCEFEAVPAALKTVPAPEVCLPVADSIRATVISNEDPQGQGRIRVDFPFAQDRVSDVWLRVMTPNAGSSDVVQKNRGLVFVPEKGDPNQPYVMGSMFHGKNAEGGKEDNHIKSIITRQGHTIEFDDAEDTLGITIKDKNGNFVHIDTKGNNIEITALETMTLNAKNINMNASENISGYAGEDINMHADRNMGYIAGEDCQTSANNIYTQAISDSMHTAKKYDVIADKARIDSTQENLELASNKEVDVQSAKKVRLF
ncbi:phage baseplate assembly protein V [Dysgonomonas sp. OttesenSCG-928-D17]|nr:phage baseplate assembly protein V [Dysgonomonas sp. OttesenSCG-928-D17]